MKIIVKGLPAAQGSKRHVGHGVMIESSKAVKPWREAVKWAALDRMAWVDSGPSPYPYPLTGPVRFTATFTFTRPRSHYRTGRNAHLLRDDAATYKTSAPDTDKIIRATLDALADAGVFRNDAQVAEILARKVYGDVAGAVLEIEAT